MQTKKNFWSPEKRRLLASAPEFRARIRSFLVLAKKPPRINEEALDSIEEPASSGSYQTAR